MHVSRLRLLCLAWSATSLLTTAARATPASAAVGQGQVAPGPTARGPAGYPAPAAAPSGASIDGSSATAGAIAAEETSRLAPPIIEIPTSPRRARWFGRVALGFAYRWAFSQSMPGATLDGELGAQDPRWSGGVRLHIEAGRLISGLPHQVVSLAPQLWLRLHERIRVGGGIDAGVLLLSRRTMPGRSMWTVALGAHVGATADLMRVGTTGAIHLELSVGAAGLTQAPGPISMMTSLALGYRL